jgi:hypothetical protein
MRRVIGWIVFSAGLLGLLAITHLFIGIRAGAVNYFPNSWVWPFFAAGILVSILLLEAGRAVLSIRLLLTVELIAVFLALLWYGLSGVA